MQGDGALYTKIVDKMGNSDATRQKIRELAEVLYNNSE